jgi:hypothetical protein
MYDEVSCSNPLDLPVPAEGAYVWHLEVIVVAVGIDPVSREYETDPVADSASIKKKKKKNTLFLQTMIFCLKLCILCHFVLFGKIKLNQLNFFRYTLIPCLKKV